ncbi:formimidoylglutamase [Natrarchaeobius chitinivorans]|uniref:Formimidoylglutamase n=1 Tax=Natrarchaeobius chitinivorans TaxID=1679083 RepID=A0A3N6MCY6_NATCH|nr:formimidoylglutamase [Natrarchaeobius chitinivorans]RQG93381.1 formimidoylglutamase [Natrarchaeobius chitinivorans]
MNPPSTNRGLDGERGEEPAFSRPDWEGWRGSSSDPNDRQFGDGIEAVDPGRADDCDVVLVGEPYDGAVIGRRGAREGPAAIRRSLAGVKTAHLTAGDPTLDANGDGEPSQVRIGDLGDLELPDGSVSEVHDWIRDVAKWVHDSSAVPVFLGGDNSLSAPNVSPLLSTGNVAVVNLDAHLDCRELRDGPTSGTPYRQLLEAGLETYVPVGVRHFETSSPYVEFVQERGGTIVPADAFEGGVDDVAATVRDAVGNIDHLYLSVDCDVLDATAAPGVSAPTPGGLSTRELFALVSALAANDRLAGLEVVECAPPLETGGRTVDAAARTIAHGVAGYLGDRDD